MTIMVGSELSRGEGGCEDTGLGGTAGAAGSCSWGSRCPSSSHGAETGDKHGGIITGNLVSVLEKLSAAD